MRRVVILLCCIVGYPMFALAQTNENMAAKQIQITTLGNAGLTLDGRLDDEIWTQARFISGFTQKEPNEGQPAEERTEVAFVYGPDALYIGARMTSNDPENIRALATRRDNEGSSEQLVISLDTYKDQRTAYSFGVTAAGVRIDYFHASDFQYDRDYSFDPVWTAKAARTNTGWTAEMRIPFSQLRFNDVPEQVWGVNINRAIPANNADAYWIMVPKDETGWASRFGDLVGLSDIKPTRRIELLPYVASDATIAADVDPNNPFTEKRDLSTPRVGVDMKMGLGPNLTLDATFNPDFGQVEADPAEVNLSAFETFFSERRPFFSEGSDLLNGIHFYSRRIGAPPHGFAEGDYTDVPDNTTIIGAAKLTGRLPTGISIAALTAVTANEYARTATTGSSTFGRTRVEPLTGYGAVRVQKEFGPSASTFGVMATVTQRDLEATERLADALNTSAYTAQANWNVRFKGGTYVWRGDFGVSNIHGNETRLSRVQRSPAHYFQRPDADHVTFDPNRTTLTGYRLGSHFSKNSGRLIWSVGGGLENPAYETNDLGRLGSADDMDLFGFASYRENTPTATFHRYSIGAQIFTGWNFGGVRQYSGGDFFADFTLKNFWNINVQAGGNFRGTSDSATRGGPLMGTGSLRSGSFHISSNPAKRFRFNGGMFFERNELDRTILSTNARLTWTPGEQWNVSIRPSYNRTKNRRQYITTAPNGPAATFDTRYIFSLIDRSTLSAQIRLNYTFTPDLTLEVYAEPFAASGRFYDHGELTAASRQELRTYGTDGSTATRQADGSIVVEDGADQFTLPNRDFNVLSFRSNVVLRWEWLPGSTLFLVWQQDRSAFDRRGELVGLGDLSDAFSAEGDQFFALKVSYWLPVK